MDLLYTGTLRRVLHRLQRQRLHPARVADPRGGQAVNGFGEQKTPQPFVTACDQFIYTEIFKTAPEAGAKPPMRRKPASSLKGARPARGPLPVRDLGGVRRGGVAAHGSVAAFWSSRPGLRPPRATSYRQAQPPDRGDRPVRTSSRRHRHPGLPGRRGATSTPAKKRRPNVASRRGRHPHPVGPEISDGEALGSPRVALGRGADLQPATTAAQRPGS